MRFTLFLSIVTLLVSGCISSTEARPRQGPTALNWAVVGLPDVPTLDPALASDPTSITVASMIYGGLVRLDSRLRVQPDAATHWRISRDGLTYTFFLRPNLRFASGQPVTATDFATSLQRALGAEGSTGTAPFYLGLIAHHSSIVRGTTRTTRGISAINRTTLRITLIQPAAHFLSALAFPASYVPDPTLIQRYGPDWTEHAAGFGPYYVQSWHHSRSITLERNPYYEGGKPLLRRITLHFYTGQRSALAAYRHGGVDVVSGWQAGETTLDHVSGIRRIAALAQDYLAFNSGRLPFHHLNARRAFAAAWSPALVPAIMGSTAFPARDFIPSVFAIASPSWRPQATPAAYLRRAHYHKGRGFPSVVLVMPHDPHLYALGRTLSHRWRQTLGLRVRLRQLNSRDYSAVLDAHAFDLALIRWGGDYPDPQDYLGTQLGASPGNVTGWAAQTYADDVALADSYHPTDLRRQDLFRQAAGVAAEHLPLLPLDEPAVTAIIRPSLRGVHLTALGTITGEWAHAEFRG